MISLTEIKMLGAIKSYENLHRLIQMYHNTSEIDLKREIISSICRQSDDYTIYEFIEKNVYSCGIMELVYQMYRTCLYKSKTNLHFGELGKSIREYFHNEVLDKMYEYYTHRKKAYAKTSQKKVPKTEYHEYDKPLLLEGDNTQLLYKLYKGSVQLIFTSPPYYNARTYSNYTSYEEYLRTMYKSIKACHRVLEEGRFIVINVSPVISRRAGREFESIRYPIHFDFHRLLEEAGFYFIDEIIWIKPESSVKNRNGGYQQTHMPLSYKPNCITESLLVYRKAAPFLLDKNIAMYDKSYANDDEFESSNCWYIPPVSSKLHPAVFPKELCKRVLKYYSFKGDVVLDPFAGIGTFGEVALEMNRIPILCESNREYCAIINKDNKYHSLDELELK